MARGATSILSPGPEAAHLAWQVVEPYAAFREWFSKQDHPTQAGWRQYLADEARFATAPRTLIPTIVPEVEAERCYRLWGLSPWRSALAPFTSWFNAWVEHYGRVPQKSDWQTASRRS